MQNEKSQGLCKEESVSDEVIEAVIKAEQVEFSGFVEAVMVTPGMASIFLKCNEGNRRISDVVNERYSRIMMAGDWKFNGEPIVFSDKGRLINGQNRLKAIIRSGVTIPMLIVYGIADENFKTMDQGCKRSTGQVLKILECKNSNTLAAALRLAYVYFDVDPTMNCSNMAYVYNEALLNFFNRHPEIEKSVEIVGMANGICSPSALAFCHFVFSKKCPQSADRFIRQLTTGEDLNSGHPALALRNRLIRNGVIRVKMPVREQIALIFKAWNFCRGMQSVKYLNAGHLQSMPEVI